MYHGKEYIILHTCCEDFISMFKRLFAARERPSLIYPDNIYSRTFIAPSQWTKKLKREEKLKDYHAQLEVKWRFDLSRACW